MSLVHQLLCRLTQKIRQRGRSSRVETPLEPWRWAWCGDFGVRSRWEGLKRNLWWFGSVLWVFSVWHYRFDLNFWSNLVLCQLVIVLIVTMIMPNRSSIDSELYHTLLKCFSEVDSTDGELLSSSLIDTSTSWPSFQHQPRIIALSRGKTEGRWMSVWVTWRRQSPLWCFSMM